MDPITGVITIGSKLIDHFFPDKAEADRKKQELTTLALTKDSDLNKAAASVIVAEAKSEHWLAATWRPIAMLTFVLLIAAHWLGFSAPNLTEEERIALIELVKVGLGGYVIGRSTEKAVKAWKAKE